MGFFGTSWYRASIGAIVAIGTLVALSPLASAQVQFYGDQDRTDGSGYGLGVDPTVGAILVGLAPDAVTFADTTFNHGFPFSPDPGDYPGTDQIYVGSTQTASHDGYSVAGSRINGPQVITLDYSALIPVNQSISTFTLGIAADDFQFPTWGQAFTASINSVFNQTLTDTLNGIDQTGPFVRFFTIGISPTSLTPDHILTLSIDLGGDGGDGWAIDYLSVGATTGSAAAAPEPGSALFALLGLGLIAPRLRRK